MASKLIVAALVAVIVISMMQSMAQEPHKCDACAQLYTEVNHVKN